MSQAMTYPAIREHYRGMNNLEIETLSEGQGYFILRVKGDSFLNGRIDRLDESVIYSGVGSGYIYGY